MYKKDTVSIEEVVVAIELDDCYSSSIKSCFM